MALLTQTSFFLEISRPRGGAHYAPYATIMTVFLSIGHVHELNFFLGSFNQWVIDFSLPVIQ
jgi:hypothetical protein